MTSENTKDKPRINADEYALAARLLRASAAEWQEHAKRMADCGMRQDQIGIWKEKAESAEVLARLFEKAR